MSQYRCVCEVTWEGLGADTLEQAAKTAHEWISQQTVTASGRVVEVVKVERVRKDRP